MIYKTVFKMIKRLREQLSRNNILKFSVLLIIPRLLSAQSRWTK